MIKFLQHIAIVILLISVESTGTGESEIASMIINESEAEGEEARNFLEDVRISFPEVVLSDIDSMMFHFCPVISD